MRYESVKFVLPAGCWLRGSKARGRGTFIPFQPLARFDGILMVLSSLSKRRNGYTKCKTEHHAMKAFCGEWRYSATRS